MKYCSQCGAQNTDEAKFCEYCGNEFVTVNKSFNDNNQYSNNTNYNGTNINETPKYQSQESTALGVCALVFSCFGGWLGLLLAIICLATKRDKTNRMLGGIAMAISVFWIIIEIILYSTGIWSFY